MLFLLDSLCLTYDFSNRHNELLLFLCYCSFSAEIARKTHHSTKITGSAIVLTTAIDSSAFVPMID